MPGKNTYRLLALVLIWIGNSIQYSYAQCISATIKGPKCAGDSNITGTFSSNPFQIEWVKNGTVVASSASAWSGAPESSVSGKPVGTSKYRIAGYGGLAIDLAGSVYIPDSSLNRIAAFNKNYPDGISVAAGNGLGNGSNQLNRPTGIFIDQFGNLFIVDELNNRVMRYAPGSNNGFLVAGGNGAGDGAAQLNRPTDVYIDMSGSVYIVDAGNHRVQKWAQGGKSGETVAGGLGAGTDSLHLYNPQGVCVDKYLNIYVADAGNDRIQLFQPGSLSGKTVAGGMGKGTSTSQLNYPKDVLVDAFSNIYVLDAGNHRVQRFSPDSKLVTTIAGSASGMAGYNSNQLNYPSAFCFDLSGNLFILDNQNYRVQLYPVAPVANTYLPLSSGTYSVIAYSFNGCSQNSNSVTVLGTTPITVTGITGICKGEAAFVKLIGPGNYTWTPAKFVTTINDSVFQLKPDTTTAFAVSAANINDCVSSTNITVTVGTKVIPQITATNCLPAAASKITLKYQGGTPSALVWYLNNAKAGILLPNWNMKATTVAGGMGSGSRASQLSLPSGLFVDVKGYVYVADPLNHRIQKWKQGDTSGITVAGGNGAGDSTIELNYPTGIHVDQNGSMFVADQNNHRIQFFPAGSKTARTIIGASGQGSSIYQLSFPTGVFVDLTGNIYITDAGNHRIQRLTADGKSIKTVAGDGTAGNGPRQLNNPQNCFVDRYGNIYIADAGNHRIMLFPKDSTNGYAVAGGRGVGNSLSQLNAPSGIVADETGNMYIADKGNHRILRWAVNDTAGVVVAGSEMGNPGTGSASFNLPVSIVIDGKGNLYTADSRNNRIQVNTVASNIDSVINVKQSGKYLVKSYSFNGCATNSDSVQINIAAPIRVKASTTSLCEGYGTLITAQTDTVSSFYWAPSGSLSFITTDSVLAKPALSTEYTVSTIASNGCKSSATVSLRVNKIPTAFVEGANCMGGADLAVNTSLRSQVVNWELNNSPLSTLIAKWKKNGVTIAGGNRSDTAQWIKPGSVFTDDKGTVYVSDQLNHRVQKWVKGATAGITIAGGKGAGNKANQLNNPTGIYVDGNGVLYVADTDNDRVQKWAPGDTAGITVAGGNGRGDKPNQLSNPAGIYVDAYNNLFIADVLNARIQKWMAGTIIGKTVAGGNGAGNNANQLNMPLGVYVDPTGKIFIADAQNDRIQQWAVDSVAGITVAGGNGRGYAADQLVLPSSVTMSNNILLITEGGNANRIKQWIIGSSTGEIVAGGNGAGNAADQLYLPANAVIDYNGNLLVADKNNGRIQQYAMADTLFPVAPQTSGNYKFTAASFGGCWTNSPVKKIDTGWVPEPPVVTDKKYCLNATAEPLAIPQDSLLWYNTSSGGVGAYYPPIPATDSVGITFYWVSKLNATKTCESKRQKLAVVVDELPGAKLTVVGNTTLRPGDTSFLKAAPDAGKLAKQLKWFINTSPIRWLPDTSRYLQLNFSMPGRYYVEITDSNKCTSRSSVVEIKNEIGDDKKLFVFPNPVYSTTKILFSTVLNQVTYISVTDMHGKLLIQKKLPVMPVGNMMYDLELATLARGMYDIQLVTGLGTVIGTQRIIKL